MKISIIIATWNAAKTLRTCLDSIVPQLNKDVELILVDGSSKDETNEIIDSYGDKVSVHISEPDKGIYDAWNKGVKAAKGDWVMFVGADDRLRPDAVANYIGFLSNIKGYSCELVSSKRTMYDEDGHEIRTVGSQWKWPICLKGMPISHPGALHSRTLFAEVGLFDISYKIGGDYDLLMRKGKRLKTAFIDIVTIDVSEGGISDSYAAIVEYYRVLKSSRDVNSVHAFLLYVNMIMRYSVKTWLRKFNINIHS